MDDPKKPYKAYVAAIVAAIGALVAQGADKLPWWVILILVSLLAGLTTFLTPNPRIYPPVGKRKKKDPSPTSTDDEPLF